MIAQPTLEKSQFGKASETYSVEKIDTTDFSPGSSGENITWDFSGSSITTSNPFFYYFSYENAPQVEDFDDATVVFTDSVFTYDFEYYQQSENEISLIGSANTSNQDKWLYTDTKKIFEYPMAYLDSFTDSFIGKEIHAPNLHSGEPSFRWGNRKVVYDGYGTLITPNNNTFNAYRLKAIEYVHDSTCIQCSVNFHILYDINDTTYYWFSAEQNHFLLKYNVRHSLRDSAVLSISKSIDLIDTGALVTNIEQSIPDKISIQQSGHFIEVLHLEDSGAQYILYNLMGQTIQKGTIINNRIKIKNTYSGILICYIQSGHTTLYKKIHYE